MRAGKIIAHHRGGQGRIKASALTALRPGDRFGHDHATDRMADTFVDVFPYLSLKGLNTERLMDRRGDVLGSHDEAHIQKRTRGHRGAGAIVAKGQFRDGK
jgi:hypothetical protein